MTKNKILIATGGTGGHIFPAYSLAESLIKKDYSVKLTIAKRGLNYLIKIQHLNIIEIPSSPLIKKDILSFVFSISIISFSIIRSVIFLLFNRPSLIFGMGGYSSFPICIAAYILGIRFIIYENNLIIGKANKFLLPYAKGIFVSYKNLEGIPAKHLCKVHEIGNIIRDDILNIDIKKNKINALDKIKILILGGSQAAEIFANTLPPIFERIKNFGVPIKVYQQCQKKQNELLSDFYKKKEIDHEIFNFTDNIIHYYYNANLVITRSGASVLGELINVKIPFISIPLPSSADNHQLKNAEFYKKKGYGFLLEEKDIKYKLYDLIISIFKDNNRIEKILSNQRQYSDKDIFKNLDDQIKKVLNEKN